LLEIAPRALARALARGLPSVVLTSLPPGTVRGRPGRRALPLCRAGSAALEIETALDLPGPHAAITPVTQVTRGGAHAARRYVIGGSASATRTCHTRCATVTRLSAAS